VPDDSTLRRLEDTLLGGPRTYTLAQLAERAGVSIERAVSFWLALGMPVADPHALLFTDEDARVIDMLVEAGNESGMARRGLISLERSAGHLTDRMVVWQAETLVEHYAEHFDLDDVSARLMMLDQLERIAPILEQQMLHAWRRHMAALAGRFAAEFSGARDAPRDALPLSRAVGFADMESFTVRTAQMTTAELSMFLHEFDERTTDIVTAGGGRVVKTIGDAVLFATDDVRAGVGVALDLAEAFGAETPTPVRVGFVWGRVLSRFGDVFGAPVNTAARLTEEAAPGTVLVDEATAALLAGDGLTLEPLAAREVDGLGALSPVQVRRAR
jgi:adenylate cyclase